MGPCRPFLLDRQTGENQADSWAVSRRILGLRGTACNRRRRNGRGAQSAPGSQKSTTTGMSLFSMCFWKFASLRTAGWPEKISSPHLPHFGPWPSLSAGTRLVALQTGQTKCLDSGIAAVPGFLVEQLSGFRMPDFQGLLILAASPAAARSRGAAGTRHRTRIEALP